jgi:hypothetical protein
VLLYHILLMELCLQRCLAGRHLVGSPYGANCCSFAKMTVTLELHSRRLQHWQSEGEFVASVVAGRSTRPALLSLTRHLF